VFLHLEEEKKNHTKHNDETKMKQSKLKHEGSEGENEQKE